MSKHAPSPWKIEPYVDAIDILDANGNAVAHLADRRIDHVGMPPDNARLIVVAPALLEACELTLSNLDHLTDVWGQEGVTRTVQDKLRAAVAAAKGATP